MRQVKYLMKFRHSVGEEAEKHLIGCVTHTLIRGMEKEVESKAKQPLTPKPVAIYLESMLVKTGEHSRLWGYFGLDKQDDRTYTFTAPDLDEFMGVKEVVKRLPFIPESKMYENFLRQVCKEMGVEEGSCLITAIRI